MSAVFSRDFDLPDERATASLGAALAPLMAAGDLILLTGDLGAGKTALARALIGAHLAAHGRAEDVPSPTFTLIQTYESPALLIAHVDLYRIENTDELRELGLAEIVDEGVAIVEWPERGGPGLLRLSPSRLDIALSLVPEGGRRARLTGTGSWAARLEGLTI
ncbi:tRNA (adenosine(37)-N6)-threonylcarbamoyltransferase complex ATPase subunit type 1 TsaE [Parvibaculum sp.]|uniref:tRNA (adenosine(37)-N6)-threonylcarbamoyltransferase complex ATPase subunit type 1 TsaE n=1 Tax=Parvibaculum sp. TaxID=2024848 RepID=UPI001D329BDD|nr:tRNA (adenosine(37)-N6)-threonylcarbamoyltransferase complex ATPase subunit type 1 TsaE [Parvibaculum sp.]MBX3489965.1 tRNA (adenosine(37)-N6)-threonylcarbamoyltransferase complex ATPase subunit type 1 TsaE [Parvibaculum sp.]MCW5726047.1 tRNA (adenosine(37)-N6)-threonylcarbamoyltransferase complex ATPase subunit type 1 TsaE [Parvibaculum sp.]